MTERTSQSAGERQIDMAVRAGPDGRRTPCPPGTTPPLARPPGTPLIAPSRLRRLTAVPAAGTVVNAVTGHPLAGVTVRVRWSADRDPLLLGDTTSDASGSFRVRFRDERAVLDRLRLVQLGDAECELDVEWAPGQLVAAPCPITGSTRFPITVPVPLPHEPVRGEAWSTIGGRVEQARIGRVDALVRELAAPASASLLGDLPLDVRHAALLELEYGFLDPDEILRRIAPLPTLYGLRLPGALERLEQAVESSPDNSTAQVSLEAYKAKASGYGSLAEVDWTFDTGELEDGNVAVAIGKFEDLYTEPALADPFDGFHAPSGLSRYRDYLRTIYAGGPSSETYAPNLEKLETRFHQGFETLNVNERRANELVIPIVRAILQAPPDGWGFGVPVAAIEAQGERTARAYLDYLIGLSDLSLEQFGRRYRLDVERPDSALSSRVAENIATLQRFFADGFQDSSEPESIVPAGLEGRAPFFLYLEEWLRLAEPFYAENVYRPVATFTAGVAPEARESVKMESEAEWVLMLIEIEDKLAEGVDRLDQGQYALARDAFLDVDAKARVALDFSYTMPGAEEFSADAISSRLEELKGITVTTPSELQTLIEFYRYWKTYELPDPTDPGQIDEFGPWLHAARLSLWISLIHLVARSVPSYLGDAALGMGEFSEAIEYYRLGTHFQLARAQLHSPAGYQSIALDLPEAVDDPSIVPAWQSHYDSYGPSPYGGPFYFDGGLPYTVDLGDPRAHESRKWLEGGTFTSEAWMVAEAIHKAEERYFRLRQADAMLEWADALYRSDEPSSVQRARELYKSVLWLHGSMPTVPNWGTGKPKLFIGPQNPAKLGQKSRAQLGIEQIEAGLNWYGSNDTLVPSLRYRPLKDAGDRYAAAAKSAQQDFLLAMSNVEDGIREGLLTSNMLKKATLQEGLAGEQVAIAEYGVVLAGQQVEAVKAQIEAKKAEIEEHDSLLGQFGDLVSGMGSMLGGIPSGLIGQWGSGAATGTQLGSGASATGAAAAAGGATALGGMSAFVAIGVMTLDSMADAQLTREQQLDALQEKALPLAQAGVVAKQREVKLATIQKHIAAADVELARQLIHFQQGRFLNLRFWSEFGAVMRRVIRRYLGLGGRYAWLAERALAFEQDRPVDVIRFDYFPQKLQGVTGADLLQADLGALDAARLDGIKQTVPVKHTYSLAANFPLEFARLKTTGRCSFLTREEPFWHAYPGTYGYRIRAVTVAAASYAGTERPRGLLTNLGLSTVSRADGSTHALMRPADALPLSEFRLAADMDVYGLPDEALLSFEGSGVETLWTLELSPVANRFSIDELSDIELALDVRAHYSPQLHAEHLAKMPTSVRRFALFSALAFDRAAVEALQDATTPSVTVELDLPKIGRLSRFEANRTIKNVVLLLPGGEALSFAGTFGPAGSPGAQVPFSAGVAFSNAEPLADPVQTTAAPLNAFIDESVDQPFQLTIEKNGDAEQFTAVTDVILGIEYVAELG